MSFDLHQDMTDPRHDDTFTHAIDADGQHEIGRESQ
jgi:hypothetical protein